MTQVRFSVGDVVKLKSGGPAMTVTKVNYGDVDLAWFTGTKILETILKDAVLELAINPPILVNGRKVRNNEITQSEECDLV